MTYFKISGNTQKNLWDVRQISPFGLWFPMDSLSQNNLVNCQRRLLGATHELVAEKGVREAPP